MFLPFSAGEMGGRPAYHFHKRGRQNPDGLLLLLAIAVFTARYRTLLSGGKKDR
jgi:hypothetical protein